jgi:CMP-N,N'-diacetyllegionaminic acid synthase
MQVNIINTERTKMENIWAIIPARSGSKGYPGKNIANVNGVPLLAHSINFAKKLKFVSRVFLSTDSEEYAEIGRKYGADVPFLRGAMASQDVAMEEDILEDIRLQCLRDNIVPPDAVVWLRPTHPLRDVETFERAYSKFTSDKYSSICIVTLEDPRIFFERDSMLTTGLSNFESRSMVRRQDCEFSYRIFGGEIFPFPTHFDRIFLGKSIGFEVADKRCKFDIDYPEDLQYLDYLLSTPTGFDRLKFFLHSN